MGTMLSQRDAKFYIKNEDKVKVLKAIKELMGKVNELGHAGRFDGKKYVEKWFSWVNTKEVLNSNALEDAIGEWGWNVEIDKDGNIIDIGFEGEKLGQEYEMFKVIAPFVKSGSYIEVDIEGDIYRWTFKNKKFKEVQAKFVFDE